MLFTFAASIKSIPIDISMEDATMSGDKALFATQVGQLGDECLTGNSKDIWFIQTRAVHEIQSTMLTTCITTNDRPLFATGTTMRS